MNEWFLSSLVMSGIFIILAMIFCVFKEKACKLISGYNFKTRDERKGYDEIRMSKDYVIFFLVCSFIFIAGGVGCILISRNCFWVSLIIFLFYFLKHVGFSYKVFDKYKK